jgi:molybdopterin converting factor small subunit
VDEVKILFVSNEDAGFADYVKVAAGTTVDAFLKVRLGETYDPAARTIRVNREPTAMNYALKEGDRVTVTPKKVDGAR